MMFTHEEMLSAVRTAGESGQLFTCGAVRDCLGVKSGDREKINQFHRRFRTFQKEASDELEKVGKNAYRLKHPERARTAAPVDAKVIAHVASADALEIAPEELMEVDAEVAPTPPLPAASAPARQPPPLPLPRASFESPSTPIESMDAPLRMIEIDFEVQELPPEAPKPAASPISETPLPMIRTWLGRGQQLGRRVAEFFGRA